MAIGAIGNQMGSNQAVMHNLQQTAAKPETKEGVKKAGIEELAVNKTKNYGKTIGQPELSEKAQKYYEELKKKYGNMDFILVSRDQKEQAKANAARYANPAKMVVLIDEDKIERMATDENYRKQYEGIIAGAKNQLADMKNKLSATGANVKGFGMQVNDDGSTSMFAVLKKSTEAQKSRIEKKQAQKRASKKADEKKAEKQAQKERLEKTSNGKEKVHKEKTLEDYANQDEYEVITANSMEELLQKIGDYSQNDMFNHVQTEQEKSVGQHIDFKG